METTKKLSFRGEISVPGDKSISHRGIMFGAISKGTTEITNFLQGADCLSTISCFQKLGISIENKGDKVLVHGKGLHGLTAPSQVLDVGNSGTTTRLISGILAGQPFPSTLDGDASIRKRPMKRIFTPLSEMGAKFQCWAPAPTPLACQTDPGSPVPYPDAHCQMDSDSTVPHPCTHNRLDSASFAPRPDAHNRLDSASFAPRPDAHNRLDSASPAPRPDAHNRLDSANPAPRPDAHNRLDSASPAPHPGTHSRLGSGKTAPHPGTYSRLGSGSASGAYIPTDSGCAPFTIQGGGLRHIHYHSPIASAQVKSAVLLAGLYGDGVTKVTEPVLSRNHTELMLSSFGAEIHSEGTTASIHPEPRLEAQAIHVPGDISSAAYFIALGLITPNSEILIQNVGTNPTRSGILQAAIAMGGSLTLLNERIVSGEPVADILVKSSALHGTVIEGAQIPTLIDEIPIIAIMAAFAEGTTTIRDAQELKVKESDRIAVVTENLKAMGGNITPTVDGMAIEGGFPLHGAQIRTHKDHRIAMSFYIASLNAAGETTFDDKGCVAISYPSFYEDIEKLATAAKYARN